MEVKTRLYSRVVSGLNGIAKEERKFARLKEDMLSFMNETERFGYESDVTVEVERLYKDALIEYIYSIE